MTVVRRPSRKEQAVRLPAGQGVEVYDEDGLLVCCGTVVRFNTKKANHKIVYRDGSCWRSTRRDLRPPAAYTLVERPLEEKEYALKLANGKGEGKREGRGGESSHGGKRRKSFSSGEGGGEEEEEENREGDDDDGGCGWSNWGTKRKQKNNVEADIIGVCDLESEDRRKRKEELGGYKDFRIGSESTGVLSRRKKKEQNQKPTFHRMPFLDSSLWEMSLQWRHLLEDSVEAELEERELSRLPPADTAPLGIMRVDVRLGLLYAGLTPVSNQSYMEECRLKEGRREGNGGGGRTTEGMVWAGTPVQQVKGARKVEGRGGRVRSAGLTRGQECSSFGKEDLGKEDLGKEEEEVAVEGGSERKGAGFSLCSEGRRVCGGKGVEVNDEAGAGGTVIGFLHPLTKERQADCQVHMGKAEKVSPPCSEEGREGCSCATTMGGTVENVLVDSDMQESDVDRMERIVRSGEVNLEDFDKAQQRSLILSSKNFRVPSVSAVTLANDAKQAKFEVAYKLPEVPGRSAVGESAVNIHRERCDDLYVDGKQSCFSANFQDDGHGANGAVAYRVVGYCQN